MPFTYYSSVSSLRCWQVNYLSQPVNCCCMKTKTSPLVTQSLAFFNLTYILPSSKHWVQEPMTSWTTWEEEKKRKNTTSNNCNGCEDLAKMWAHGWMWMWQETQCGLLHSKLLLVWRTPEEVGEQCTTPLPPFSPPQPWLLNAKIELCWCWMWI